MRYLLDVNALLALFDPAHVEHDHAHAWWANAPAKAWASCPLTENGFARVISNAAYATVDATASEAFERLHAFSKNTDHEFWPDSISLRGHAPPQLTPNQITDYYLARLAKERDAKLATFDRRLARAWQTSGLEEAILLIGVDL